MRENDLSFVLLEMADLIKKFGKDKAFKILDCCTAIHEATKDFPDDIKEDAIEWVIDVSRRASPVSVPNDSNTVNH